VLGGYSQGAAVIDVISAVPIPAVGFNNPLPPNVPDHVAAIAVFGNPSAKLGLPLTVSPVWGGRSIDLCNAADPICQTDGQSLSAHRAYVGGLERQEENPTLDVLDRLAKTLKVHVSEFFVEPAKGASPPKPLPGGRRRR